MIFGAVTITGNFPTITVPVTFTNNGQSVTQPVSVSQVQGLTAAVNSNAVTLNWQAATASDNSTLTYNIYRTSLTSGNSTSYRVAQVQGLSYVDSSLSAGTYSYRISASDGTLAVGPYSSSVIATVSSSSTVATSTSPVTIELDSATPAGTQVQTGATGVNLLTFDVVNPSSDPVKITQLEAVESVGFNTSSLIDNSTPDFINLNLLYVANGQAVSGGQFQSLSLLPGSPAPWGSSVYPSNLIIPANSTATFTIKGDVPQYTSDPSMVGTMAAITVIPVAAVDTNTNLSVSIVGKVNGNIMSLVKGQ